MCSSYNNIRVYDESFYAMSFNDNVAINNNNVSNENKFNIKKDRSTVYQIKKLLKPFTVLLKKNKNTYKKSPQPHYFNDEDEEIDNLANELLENEIFEEIDCCEDFSGVPVYNNGHLDIMPVFRGQRYIPVHFAKTEAGTFFWTSMMTASADSDIAYDDEKNAITYNQEPELQVCYDRWAQA